MKQKKTALLVSAIDGTDVPLIIAMERQTVGVRAKTGRQVDSFFCREESFGYIATRKGKAIGYVAFETSKRGISIARLVVAKGHQGQGVGRALVEIVSEQFGAYGTKLLVKVNERNVGAIMFFKACGFVACPPHATTGRGEVWYRFARKTF